MSATITQNKLNSKREMGGNDSMMFSSVVQFRSTLFLLTRDNSTPMVFVNRRIKLNGMTNLLKQVYNTM